MVLYMRKRGEVTFETLLFLAVALIVFSTLAYGFYKSFGKGSTTLSGTQDQVIAGLNNTPFLNIGQLSPDRLATIERNKQALKESAALAEISRLLSLKQCDRASDLITGEMRSSSESYQKKLVAVQSEVESCRSQTGITKTLQEIATLRQTDAAQAAKQLAELLASCTSPTVECADVAAESVFVSLPELEKMQGFSLESHVKKTFFSTHALALPFHTLVLGTIYTKQRLYDRAHDTYLAFADPTKNPSYRIDDRFFDAALDRLDTLPSISFDRKQQQFDLYVHLWESERGSLNFDKDGQLIDTSKNMVVSPAGQPVLVYAETIREMTEGGYATRFSFAFHFGGVVNDDDFIAGEHPFVYTSERFPADAKTPRAPLPRGLITKDHVLEKGFTEDLTTLEDTEPILIGLEVYDFLGHLVCSSPLVPASFPDVKPLFFQQQFGACGAYLILRLDNWYGATPQGIPVDFSYDATPYFAPITG